MCVPLLLEYHMCFPILLDYSTPWFLLGSFLCWLSTSFLIIFNQRDTDFFYLLFWNTGLIFKSLVKVSLLISLAETLCNPLSVSVSPSLLPFLFLAFHMHCILSTWNPFPNIKGSEICYYIDMGEFYNSKFAKLLSLSINKWKIKY